VALLPPLPIAPPVANAPPLPVVEPLPDDPQPTTQKRPARTRHDGWFILASPLHRTPERAVKASRYDRMENGRADRSWLRRHSALYMSLRTLAPHAQRIGKVFASATTWAMLVRARGWRRPRQRVHPPKPTVGVRAAAPNEIWHVDLTVLKLLDGTKAYLHAIIDNYSRKILAWTVAERLDPTATCQLLLAAGRHMGFAGRPLLFADSGIENINSAVDDTLLSACLERILAQIDVTYSNSMIEALWRSLKHQWLYLNSLDSIERLRSLVKFLVDEHNTQTPHSAFAGQTPDEMYFGTAVNMPAQLAARSEARAERLAANRAMTCSGCNGQQASLPASPIPP